MITRTRAVLCVFILLASLVAQSAPSDVIVSGEYFCRDVYGGAPAPPYAIQWGNLWSEVGSQASTGVTLIAAGGGGRLLALESPPPGHYYQFNLLELRADETRTQLFSMDGFAGVGLVADAAGKIFVLGESPNPGLRIFVLSETGSLLASYPVAGITWDFYQRIELAADQCTLFYDSWDANLTKRFNVCTGTQLPDLPVPSTGRVGILPDGDILTTGSSQVRRYSQNGLLVRTYPLGSFLHVGSFGLAAEGHRALVHNACDGRIFDVDLDTGVVTVRSERVFQVRGPGTGVVSTNGWTAALGSAAAIGASDVPLLSTSALAVLFVLLAFVALRRLSF